MSYQSNFTWSHPIGDYCLGHHDGAVSLMISWNGFDAEMLSEAQALSEWTQLYSRIARLDESITAEFHFWHEVDDSKLDVYEQRTATINRGKELGAFIRAELADHYRQYGMGSEVAIVLTKTETKKQRFKSVKQQLIAQSKRSIELENTARLFLDLNNAKLCTYDAYKLRIIQTYNRTRFFNNPHFKYDESFFFNEQIIDYKPKLEDDYLNCGDYICKMGLLFLYPDAMPGWFLTLSTLACEYHVSQIIKPLDTAAAMKKSRHQEKMTSGTQDETLQEQQGDLSAFRQYLAHHKVPAIHNCFIFQLYGPREVVLENFDQLKKSIEDPVNGGVLHDFDYIQLPYFRYALPGQGYKSKFFRPDDLHQVANMSPVQVFKTGSNNPDQIRIGTAGQYIGFNFNDEINHSFTTAMTRGGKGVEKVASICETYPLGIDWYILEIGKTYQWTVEGFGGNYYLLDPDKTSINPLPPYAMADVDNPNRLDSKVVGGTIEALAFLLVGERLIEGKIKLNMHEAAVAAATLRALYVEQEAGSNAPTLPQFLNLLKHKKWVGMLPIMDDAASISDSLDSGLQVSREMEDAARFMAGNLNSFLNSAAGEMFSGQDNFVLSEGICGVDLGLLEKADKNLLVFYLVFLSLRFTYMAYNAPNQARVLLDELHAYVRVAPTIIGSLVSGIARMGGKEAASIDLVSQEIDEIDVIEPAIINQMYNKIFLYRQSGHDDIAERVNMPSNALNIWSNFPNPIGLDYRPGIRCVGDDYFSLHLSFPQTLLDLATTSGNDKNLKHAISQKTGDVIERLYYFREAKSTHHDAA